MANSRFGAKHSVDTINKMSEAKRGEKHPQFGLKGENSYVYGKIHSEETSRSEVSVPCGTGNSKKNE